MMGVDGWCIAVSVRAGETRQLRSTDIALYANHQNSGVQWCVYPSYPSIDN
jgi:hypothetical protein